MRVMNGSLGGPQPAIAGAAAAAAPTTAPQVKIVRRLMRDPHLAPSRIFGTTWGWDPDDHASVVTELQAAIADYSAWAPRIFGWGTSGQLSASGVNYHACQPFHATNDFHQQMVPAVLDLAQRWPLFDPTVHPGPATPTRCT
jgi:hypothetical protein